MNSSSVVAVLLAYRVASINHTHLFQHFRNVRVQALFHLNNAFGELLSLLVSRGDHGTATYLEVFMLTVVTLWTMPNAAEALGSSPATGCATPMTKSMYLRGF